MLRIGDDAPDFEASDQDRQLHRLSDERGQWVILYFYPKDETTGCTAEAYGFRDIYEDISRKAVLMGVSADSVESHKSFAERHSLPFTLLADPDRRIISAYGAEPTMLGKRISFLIDPEGKVAQIYDKVVPERHAEEVMRELVGMAV